MLALQFLAKRYLVKAMDYITNCFRLITIQYNQVHILQNEGDQKVKFLLQTHLLDLDIGDIVL